jgi:hypothetical protein
LSPDRTCVVFSRPYSQWSNRPDEDTTTLAVGLDLIVHKIDQTEGEVEYLLKRERLGNISFRISNPTLVKYQLAPWPTYAGCFTDASQVFSTLESATQTIINWDLQASQSSQLASRQVPEAILVSEISSPLAWLHGGLAVACSDGVRVFSDDLLELVAHGQFERSLPSETSVSFSDSRKTLLVLHGERLQILGINGGPALADVSIPELDEDAFLLNDQVRAQAIRAGIPILDWESPKLAEAPDRSWFAVKMTGTKTFGEGAKSRTVEDSRLIVIQRSGGSHGLESNSIWRSPIPDELSRMRVSDDGRWCLLHNDHQLFVLDSHSTNSRRALFTKELPLGPIRSVAVSPQAGQLAIAVGDRLDIFNLADGSPITSLNVANPAYLKFSADGRSLLVSSLDGMIRMISIDTNRVTRQWTAVRRNAAFLVADQHEQWLATAGQELALRRWNFLSSEAAGESPIESPVAALQLFEEQKILLAILIDNSISIHAWPNLKRIQRIAPQANTILDACPSQDGKRILVARSDATLIFDTLSGMEVLVVMPSTEPLAAAAILENGRELLQLSRRGHLERHTLHRPVFVGAQRNAN